MTRTEHALARRWRPVLLVCAVVALVGAAIIIWANRELTDEANRRGNAIGTLTGDVRVLRAQVKAQGLEPAAPDPARAVKNLSGRTEVPVPIPGPPGPRGAPGPSGKPAPTITPSPGPSGRPGADSTAPGPSGRPGQDATGTPGQDGQDGRDGSPPAGWSWTDRYGDTYRCSRAGGTDSDPQYTCPRTSSGPADSEPEPAPSDSSQPGLLGLAYDRRKW